MCRRVVMFMSEAWEPGKIEGTQLSKVRSESSQPAYVCVMFRLFRCLRLV